MLDQARYALQYALARAEEVDEKYNESQDRSAQLEGDLAETKGELESKTSGIETLRARFADVENS